MNVLIICFLLGCVALGQCNSCCQCESAKSNVQQTPRHSAFDKEEEPPLFVNYQSVRVRNSRSYLVPDPDCPGKEINGPTISTLVGGDAVRMSQDMVDGAVEAGADLGDMEALRTALAEGLEPTSDGALVVQEGAENPSILHRDIHNTSKYTLASLTVKMPGGCRNASITVTTDEESVHSNLTCACCESEATLANKSEVTGMIPSKHLNITCHDIPQGSIVKHNVDKSPGCPEGYELVEEKVDVRVKRDCSGSPKMCEGLFLARLPKRIILDFCLEVKGGKKIKLLEWKPSYNGLYQLNKNLGGTNRLSFVFWNYPWDQTTFKKLCLHSFPDDKKGFNAVKYSIGDVKKVSDYMWYLSIMASEKDFEWRNPTAKACKEMPV